jgi:hypothetical protein
MQFEFDTDNGETNPFKDIWVFNSFHHELTCNVDVSTKKLNRAIKLTEITRTYTNRKSGQVLVLTKLPHTNLWVDASLKQKWILMPNESMLSITDSDEYSGSSDSQLWTPVCVESTNSILSGVSYYPYTLPDGSEIDCVELTFRPNAYYQQNINDFKELDNSHRSDHTKLKFPYFADWTGKNAPTFYAYIGKNGDIAPALYSIDAHATEFYLDLI